jgi:hypothetical protein
MPNKVTVGLWNNAKLQFQMRTFISIWYTEGDFKTLMCIEYFIVSLNSL